MSVHAKLQTSLLNMLNPFLDRVTWSHYLATRECGHAISFLAKMATKVIFWSCVVAVFAYFAYQELTVVTDSISVQVHLPAKRSDVFRLLLDPEFVPRKFQPLW